MTTERRDLLDRVGERHLGRKRGRIKRAASKVTEAATSPIKRGLGRHKGKIAIAMIATMAIGGFGFFSFGKDYVTKRQDYPQRNILYQALSTEDYAGAEADASADLADIAMISEITRGDERGTKLGDLLGTFEWKQLDQGAVYHLKDADNRRLAHATIKEEHVQPGLSIRGTANFSERSAALVGDDGTTDQGGKYITYSITPERGLQHIELNVLQDEDGTRTLVNELVTTRSPLSFFDQEITVRDKTALYEFTDTAENRKDIKTLFAHVDAFNDASAAASKSVRSAIIDDIVDTLDDLERQPVYVSHEDGMIDWLPQESTTFLFSNPDISTRIRAATGDNIAAKIGKGKATYPVSIERAVTAEDFVIDNSRGHTPRFRVENHWDLFPGNYPGLNKIAFGEKPNQWKPFAHRNNGGYTITDSHGDVARIDIQDFWIHYGDDLVYDYYLDKDGDGVIEEDTELIGKVYYGVSRDKSDATEAIGKGHEEKDVTRKVKYVFMAGSDFDTRFEDFYLCNAVESFLVNEVNRGFGKHSILGAINNERSNILLLEHLDLHNLGRALTPESSIVAKNDMVALLRAAGRDYIDTYQVSSK